MDTEAPTCEYLASVQDAQVTLPDGDGYDAVHDRMLSLWSRSIYSGNYETAIKIEELQYREAVKRQEKVENWDRWQADTFQMRLALTQCIAEVRASAGAPEPVPGRCLLVYNNQSGLAHEAQLARNVLALRRRGHILDIEVVYLLGPVRDREAAQEMFGTKSIHYLQARGFEEAGGRLNALCHERRVASVVYPSSFILAFWMSLFVAHPNQKFLQMKYYPLHAGRIRRWAGGQRNADRLYTINGHAFEQLPVLDFLPKDACSLGDRIEPEGPAILGSISRSEKIVDPDYNRFIESALQRHPQLRYAFTGNASNRGLIPRAIREHPRTDCWGWVKPQEVIDKFSIYLEPFPWGGGDMTFLALARGLPYLILKTPETERFGVWSYLKMISDSQGPLTAFSFCDDLGVLNERLDRLLAEPGLRRDLGRAWKNAVSNFRPGHEEVWVDFLCR